ncbi:MAG: DUF805 domain-containing protein [Oceanicaulis sp.]
MSIAHALFVPNGRISKGGFATGAIILIVIGFVSGIIPLFMSMAAATGITTLLGIVVAYCWVALWIKRFHQGGMSGWWTVLVVIVWMIANYAVGQAVILMSGIDMSAMQGSTNFSEIMAMSQEIARETALPTAIANAVVSAIFAFGLNAFLKSEAGENKYGPAPQ